MTFPNLVPKVSHLPVLLFRPEDGKMRDSGNEVGFFYGLASEFGILEKGQLFTNLFTIPVVYSFW